MERSDLPTADTSRTPPHLHQARFALPYHVSATQAPCPCLCSACHRPSPARQRSTPRQHRELLQGHPERRCLASLRVRARARRRRQGNRLARPPGRRGPVRRAPRRLAGLRAARRAAGGAPREAGSKRGGRRAPPSGSCSRGWSASTTTSGLPLHGRRAPGGAAAPTARPPTRLSFLPHLRYRVRSRKPLSFNHHLGTPSDRRRVAHDVR